MKKKIMVYSLVSALTFSTALTGCGSKKVETETTTAETLSTETPSDATTEDVKNDSEFVCEDNGDGTVKLTAYTGSSESVVLPAEINGKKITEIGESCFAGSLTLKEIEISEGVEKIDDYAFECCSYLHKVYLPKSLKSIGNGAFSGCVDLSLVDTDEGLTTIGDGAFLFCQKLVTIELPASTEAIGEYAFAYCTSLASVNLYNTSVTKISDRTFIHCTALTSVMLPDSITSIGKRAFSNCEGIKEMYSSHSLKELGAYAYENCYEITSAYIPCEVLETGVFSGCGQLTQIILGSDVKKISKDAYAGTAVDMITIPASVTEIEENDNSDEQITQIELEEGSSFVLVNGDLYSADKSTLLIDVTPLQSKKEGEEENQGSEEENTSETEGGSATSTDAAYPSLDEVIKKNSEYSNYSVITNEDFAAFSEEYVAYNSEVVAPDTVHNNYITLYKGEVQPHFLGMVSVINHDEGMIETAKTAFGDDYEKMYLMMNHGLKTEIDRFKMPKDVILFTGVFDSQLRAITGTDTDPTQEELKACIGKEFTDPIMTSTTTDPKVAVNFGSTMFIIYASADSLNRLGSVCMDAYMGTNEDEILLNGNVKYKVIDVGTTTVETENEYGEKTSVVEKYVTLELVN